jgi:hypothetical protein
MADSFGNYAGFEDIPPSALSASHLATDHDVAARIAHGHTLLRRDIHDRAGVSRLVVELTEWSVVNRDLLARRFTDSAVTDTYSGVAEPFVVPAASSDIDAQVELLHRQLRHQVEWLERLRLTIPERQQPATAGDEPRSARSPVARRSVAVLATSASSSAAAVVGAVARATGILPVVIEDHPGERRSFVRAVEDALPTSAIGVVVLEPPEEGPNQSSSTVLLALGYAAGALGLGDVIAVLAPGVTVGSELRDFATVVMDHGDGWRQQLESCLADAGLAPSTLVSSIRRS